LHSEFKSVENRAGAFAANLDHAEVARWAPSYAQQQIDQKAVTGKFGLIASNDGRDGPSSMGHRTPICGSRN